MLARYALVLLFASFSMIPMDENLGPCLASELVLELAVKSNRFFKNQFLKCARFAGQEVNVLNHATNEVGLTKPDTMPERFASIRRLCVAATLTIKS